MVVGFTKSKDGDTDFGEAAANHNSGACFVVAGFQLGQGPSLQSKTLLSSFLPHTHTHTHTHIQFLFSFSWFMLLFPDQLDYFNVLVFSRNSVNLGQKTRKLTCRNSWVFFFPFHYHFYVCSTSKQCQSCLFISTELKHA